MSFFFLTLKKIGVRRRLTLMKIVVCRRLALRKIVVRRQMLLQLQHCLSRRLLSNGNAYVTDVLRPKDKHDLVVDLWSLAHELSSSFKSSNGATAPPDLASTAPQEEDSSTSTDAAPTAALSQSEASPVGSRKRSQMKRSKRDSSTPTSGLEEDSSTSTDAAPTTVVLSQPDASPAGVKTRSQRKRDASSAPSSKTVKKKRRR